MVLTKKSLEKLQEWERERALDRLSAALAAAGEHEQRNPSPSMQGKPCPTCGRVWQGRHHCEPGTYPDGAIPF